MSEVRGNLIPNFVTAQTPEGLRRIMLATNARTGKWNNYHSIQQIKDSRNKTVWIAWFWEEITAFQSVAQGSDAEGNRAAVQGR